MSEKEFDYSMRAKKHRQTGGQRSITLRCSYSSTFSTDIALSIRERF